MRNDMAGKKSRRDADAKPEPSSPFTADESSYEESLMELAMDDRTPPDVQEIEAENQALLRRQSDFRTAAEYVARAQSQFEEVQKIVLFGSVALPLAKEVPRFRRFRRTGIAVRHECSDVDLAVWVTRLDNLTALRKARSRALNQLLAEKNIGVAHHSGVAICQCSITNSWAMARARCTRRDSTRVNERSKRLTKALAGELMLSMRKSFKKVRRAGLVSLGIKEGQLLAAKGASEMATSQISSLVKHVRRAALAQQSGAMTDGQLLECFLARRDEIAFEALLRRHGPMVLGVCQRVLGSTHEADDAFQATFLVLLRKATSLRQPELVGNWLYGTAYRAALEAKAATACWRARERRVREMPERPAATELDVFQELRPILDQELNRLPDKYRVPVVLCDLEGQKRRDVARRLSIPEGTLSSRLATARRMLAKRLARHRLSLSSGALALALSQQSASAAVPNALIASTVRIASSIAGSSTAIVCAASAQVGAIAKEVMKTMFVLQLQRTFMFLLGIGVLLVVGAATYRAMAAEATIVEHQVVPKQEAAENAAEVRRFEGHGAAILRVAFAPDGKLAASSSMSNTIRIWDLATGKLLHVLEGHTDRVDCATYSPNGKQLLSCSWDGTVRLWDVEHGKELKRFEAKGDPGLHVCNVFFFKDGNKFLWNSVDHHSLQIWDAKTGEMQKEFGEHPDHVSAVALSPKGDRVLEGNWDSNLKLWDIESGKELRQFQGHSGRVNCVAISPNGRLGLSASGADKPVILWDLETGKEVRRFEGHTEPVDFVAFSPDGKRALSAGQDKMVRLWEVATAKELYCFEGHTDRVECVAFSPDGRHALSGSDDKTLRLWRLPK
jgi:RNA polymerase sigma factor (sigma-70 family)